MQTHGPCGSRVRPQTVVSRPIDRICACNDDRPFRSTALSLSTMSLLSAAHALRRDLLPRQIHNSAAANHVDGPRLPHKYDTNSLDSCRGPHMRSPCSCSRQHCPFRPSRSVWQCHPLRAAWALDTVVCRHGPSTYWGIYTPRVYQIQAAKHSHCSAGRPPRPANTPSRSLHACFNAAGRRDPLKALATPERILRNQKQFSTNSVSVMPGAATCMLPHS